MSQPRLRKQFRDNNDEDYQNKRRKERHHSPREHKIMSALGAVNESSRSSKDFKETSKPTISEAYKKPEVLNRNKRMFGLLMGHLGMARQKLEADSSLIKKQSDISTSVAEKNAKEAQRLEILKRKEKQQQIYDSKVANIKHSFHDWKSHMETLVHFIYTDSEPKLSWLPANHNKLSRELLKARNDEVLRKIAEREVADDKKLKELEDCFLSQNMGDHQEGLIEESVEEVNIDESHVIESEPINAESEEIQDVNNNDEEIEQLNHSETHVEQQLVEISDNSNNIDVSQKSLEEAQIEENKNDVDVIAEENNDEADNIVESVNEVHANSEPLEPEMNAEN